ncbi:MAG: YkgJ family cysteine cluster protein [Campylobacter sputorum]|uniref:YkgJ family cysteine cluster protein n=1 Tax=Campylobacter sputorum TaxID=206 RepID=UPI000B777037|nr:YkgJ family cysteine cluster protein [Campylobacter sputorum]ASM38593.1 putative Fe-S cluster-containing protein [Campylobacter sputorum bv. paraureolyticus LMG 11764]MDY6120820.1 YkgJ family cysteine cluster protein [Campylobacter sputorum]
MSEFDFTFDSGACKKCGGKCCTGESGYIWISKDEIFALCKHLNTSFDDFKHNYLIKVGFRFSLKEKNYNNGKACIFFDEENLNCSIYDFRPNQCKTFPFWSHFKNNFDELERECIGVKKLS